MAGESGSNFLSKLAHKAAAGEPPKSPQEPPAGPAKPEAELPEPDRTIYIDGFDLVLTSTKTGLKVEDESGSGGLNEGDSLIQGSIEYKLTRSNEYGTSLQLRSEQAYKEGEESLSLVPGKMINLAEPGLTPEEAGSNPLAVFSCNDEGDVQIVNRGRARVFKNGEKVVELATKLAHGDVVQVENKRFEFDQFDDLTSELTPLKTARPRLIRIESGESVKLTTRSEDEIIRKLEVYEAEPEAKEPDLSATQPSAPAAPAAPAAEPTKVEVEAGKKWWKRSLKEHLNDAGSIYKLDKNRLARELPTLAMAAVAEVFPQLSPIALVVNLGLLTKNIGGRLRGRYKAFKELKEGAMLPPDAVLKNILTHPSKFLQEADLNLTDKDIENRSLLSLMFNDSAVYKHFVSKDTSLSNFQKASAIGFGILTGIVTTSAMQLAKITPLGGLPGIGLVFNRFAYRAFTQTVTPRVIDAAGSMIFARSEESEGKGKDWFDLALSFSSAYTIGMTTMAMIRPAAHQVVEWAKDLHIGEAAATEAPLVVAAATQTAAATLHATTSATPTSTETPMPSPTPDLVAQMGWEPGEVAGLDSVLQTAQAHDLVLEHNGSTYYFLDHNPGPDAIVQGTHTYIRDVDNFFRVDFNGNGVLDATEKGTYWTADALGATPELMDKNVNSAGHLELPALFGGENPPPSGIDTDGDGDPDLMMHTDGHYYLDVDDNNEINPAIDVAAVEAPVGRIIDTGFQIDKLQLNNGWAYWRSADNHLVGLTQTVQTDGSASQWIIDHGENGQDVVIGNQIVGVEDIKLAEAPLGLRLVPVNADTGLYRLEADQIKFADGSQWNLTPNAADPDKPTIVGTLANGQKLILDNSLDHNNLPDKASLAQYQYELALARPELTPVEVGRMAMQAQIAGTSISDLVGLPAPVSGVAQPVEDSGWKNVGGRPVGELSNGGVLSTTSGGGWTGLVQGEVLSHLGMDVQNITTSPDVFGNIIHRAVVEANIDKSVTVNSKFSDLGDKQTFIREFFNTEALRLNFNAHLIDHLPQGLSYENARNLVDQYMGEKSVSALVQRGDFIRNIPFQDFEDWLKNHGYILR